MLDLTPYGRLSEFIKLTDKMIGEASKDAIAQAARMLAIQVSHYQSKFGILPPEEVMDLMETESLTEKQAEWMANGLEMLAVTIASVKDDTEPATTLQ